MAASGATIEFMSFFSLLMCGLSCQGAIITAKRENVNVMNCSYGTCLCFFGFIPLLVVSSALLELAGGSQADLVALCYYEVHDTDMLK